MKKPNKLRTNSKVCVQVRLQGLECRISLRVVIVFGLFGLYVILRWSALM